MQTFIGGSLFFATWGVLLFWPASRAKSAATSALGLLAFILFMLVPSFLSGKGIMNDAALEAVAVRAAPFVAAVFGYGILTTFASIFFRWVIAGDSFFLKRMPRGIIRQAIWLEYWPEDWKTRRSPDG